MIRFLFYVTAVFILLHGLVHLMGWVAYWPLGQIAELPYKTTLLDGRWSVSSSGMRLYSVLWLLTAVALVASVVGLLAGQSWWLPLMTTAVLLSLLITILDWSNAFRGAIISLVILVPLLLLWGLHIQPRPFAAYPQESATLTHVPLPTDLPAPVARYFEVVLGEEVPVVETAVISGHGTLRFMGITFPARFRFTHIAGQGYRHYIETTIFGIPLLKVNERYLNGQARMELPVGIVENEPNIDMAANLGLWGESIWLPSIFITDPRVRWQAIDENSARLIVPFESGEDTFTVVFDSETGLIQSMEALRYRDATDTEKIPWQLEIQAWDEFNDILIPISSTATWADEGTPWLIMRVEDIIYNVDVDDYIRNEGA